MIWNNVELHNIVEVVSIPGRAGQRLCRIPLDLRAKLNDSAQANSIQTPGAEIRFNLLPGRLAGEDIAVVTLEMAERPAIAEVYSGPFLIDWHVIDTAPTEVVVASSERQPYLHRIAERRNLPFDPHLYRVVLPWRPSVRLHTIEGDVAPPRPVQVPAMRYLAYGSSITHGNNSTGAMGGYAMRTAQRLGVDLINLGFGGGAHCEAEMADYIASRDDWHFATLELGINLVSWLAADSFAERVDTFISTIAAAHPDKWIFCIDMFPFYMDFDPTAERNHAYRAAVREAVERLPHPKLLHLDGRDLLKDMTGLCADVVHPSPSGMEEIAANLTTRIQRTMTA